MLEHVAGIMARADLGSALRDKSFAICQVNNPGFAGMVRVTGDTMALHVPYDPADGVGQFTAARCVELARAAAGIPDLAVKPLEVLPWQSTVAGPTGSPTAGSSWRVTPPMSCRRPGRSAPTPASRTPPTWPGSSPMCSTGGPMLSLLETYDTERRPVATLTVEQALATGRDWFGAELPPEVAAVEFVDEVSVKFGYRYDGAGFQDAHHPDRRPRRPCAARVAAPAGPAGVHRRPVGSGGRAAGRARGRRVDRGRRPPHRAVRSRRTRWRTGR